MVVRSWKRGTGAGRVRKGRGAPPALEKDEPGSCWEGREVACSRCSDFPERHFPWQGPEKSVPRTSPSAFRSPWQGLPLASN